MVDPIASSGTPTPETTPEKEQLGLYKQALRSLHIAGKNVLSWKEYDDKIVVVTTAGQKHTWMKGKP